MSSGLIYAVIVGLWAVVLVPMWLRRHDEASESRSVDRFEGAMRTLSRRSGSADRREVLVPRRASVALRPDGVPAQDARARAAARRRRTSLTLLGLLLVTAGLGFLGVLPIWLVVVPLLLAVGFGWQSHVATQRAAAQATAARRARAAQSRRLREESVEARLAGRPARRPATAPVVEPVVAVVEPAVADEALYDAVAEHVWDPVPVPLPTYVTAPKAPRSVRVIDLTKPGAWTSGHLEVQDPAAAALDAAEGHAVAEGAAPGDPNGIVVGEVLVERLRAVNE
ncbi:MAG TPA: hypothetical protein VIM19_20070 [Actinomycetes bacterium]